MMVPALKLENIKGISVPECNGWIVSTAQFIPKYLVDISFPSAVSTESIRTCQPGASIGI